MTIEAALIARLAGDATVGGLVGARIYFAGLPQGVALPAVRLWRIGTVRPSAMGADAGIVGARFQVDAWAATAGAMGALRQAIRASLQRWRAPAGDPVVQDTFIDDERDFGLDDELRAWRGGLDVTVWRQE